MERQLEAVNIKKIGVLSFAITSTIMSMFLTLFLFLIIFIFFSSQISSTGILSLLPFQVLSLPIILLIVLIYGVIAFVSSIIGGLFYNLASLMTKGIKLYS
jgi:hypothetical protein